MRRKWTHPTVAVCAALSVLFAAGCGGGGASTAGAGTTPASGQGPAWARDRNDALSARMWELSTRLAGVGLTPGLVEGRGFLAGGGVDTTAVVLPARACLTIIAISSTGIRDLDSTLFAPEGDTLAEDVEPDPHPTIQVCGGNEPRRLYYSLRAYDGAGAYMFASFVGPQSSFEGAARVIGGRPGVAGTTQAEVEEDSRLREFGTGVGRRGFEPGRSPADVRLSLGQSVRVPLPVRAARCYSVGAFPGVGTARIDLRVLDDLGAEVARDISATPDASLQFCTDRDGDWSVEVIAAIGAGTARVAFYEAPVATVGGTSGLWLGQRSSTLAWPEPLDQALARALAAARADGWSGPREAAHGQLVPGEAVAHEVAMPAGRCSLVVLTGGGGLAGLALRVADSTGRTLAERAPGTQTVTARLCSSAALRARVEIVARRGGGDYALHTLARALPIAEPGVDAAAQGAVLDAEADAASTGWTALSGTTRALGAQTATIAPSADGAPVELARGECVRVAVVGTGLDDRIETKIVAEDGRALASAAGRVTEVQQCAPRDGVARVHVEARARTGDTRTFVRFWRRSRPE